MTKRNLQDLFDQEANKLTHMSSYTATELQKTVAGQVHKGKKISLDNTNKMREGWQEFLKDSNFRQQWVQRQSESAKKRWELNPYKPTPEVIERRRQAILKTNAEKRAAKPIEVKEPKKRGRPRTRPLPDPNAPKRGRGRPKKA